MPMSFLFWVVYVIAVLFGAWSIWPFGRSSGGWLVVAVLIGLLGWRVFGGPVQ